MWLGNCLAQHDFVFDWARLIEEYLCNNHVERGILCSG